MSDEAKPYPKSQQLARKERRYHRKVAGAKRWQQIAAAKQGPRGGSRLPRRSRGRAA